MGDPFVRPGLPREPHVQALIRNKYPNTGDADTTKHEWLTEQHRDTIASIVARTDHLLWLSVAENMSSHELRNKLLEDMAQGPCGKELPPLKPLWKQDDDDGTTTVVVEEKK